jgi:HNH endonuclease
MGRSITKVIDIIQDKSYIDEETECFIYIGCTNQHGYGIIGYNAKTWLVHRLIFKYVMNRELNCDVLHSCDNPPCWNPAHLYGGTHQDNMADKIAKGRQNKGVEHYRAALTEQQVREIRSIKNPSYERLAEKYNVDASAIRKAILRITWKHI